jgi:hypothetical protein
MVSLLGAGGDGKHSFLVYGGRGRRMVIIDGFSARRGIGLTVKRQCQCLWLFSTTNSLGLKNMSRNDFEFFVYSLCYLYS